MITCRDFNLVNKPGHVYEIEDSCGLSVRQASKRILGGYPIFSQNRFSGSLYFTIVPYATPDYFKRADCPQERISQEELIASVFSRHKGGPFRFPISGICMKEEHIFAEKQEIIFHCGSPSSILLDRIEVEGVIPGKALDLGCGQGANIEPLLRNRWFVIAVDISYVAISLCEKFASHRLVLVQDDILKMKFPSSTDLVVAADVLPYLPEEELPALFLKIRNCLRPGGVFIGTLFFCSERPVPEEVVINQVLGAHLFDRPSAPRVLLESAGFNVVECSLRYDFGLEGGPPPGVAQFMATVPGP